MMRLDDSLRFTLRTLGGYPLRSALVLLAMTIAVMAVLLLTALGEGARRYVIDEFANLGTNLLIVLPGRAETTGGPPPIVGETTRDLTIGDALALLRSRHVERVAPLIVGQAGVSSGGREREVTILGTTRDFLPIRNLATARGRFLPPLDPDQDAAVCVLGKTTASELFGNRSPVGEKVRIGGRRFRIIGVLADQGQTLAAPIDDVAIIPVASAQSLFNREGLFRILVQGRGRGSLDAAKADILRIIRERHDGDEDITVIAQDALVSTFDRIFTVLNLAVAAIAGISLVVAGILIMNVMLVSVSQRTEEIGLLSALGASRRQILRLFLTEAAIIAAAGAAIGLVVSALLVHLALALYPDFPLRIPLWAVAAAVVVAVSTGLIFGVHPARKAASVDPVVALGSHRG